MMYTLPHNPEILQAYCTADREGHRKTRLAAPQAKLWSWLDRVFDRFDAERREAEQEQALDRMSPEQLADIGLTPDEVRARAETNRQAEALAHAARWGL